MGPTRLLRSMRAVRRFSDQPIPDDVLNDILEVARWTGSSTNTQPWELVVVRDREALAELAMLSPNGDHLALARLAVVQVMHGNDVGPALDAGRQVERIMLAAWSHGIGSCIGAIFPRPNQQRAKALLGIPTELSLRTAVSLGYPESDRSRFLSADPTVLRRPIGIGRRPQSDVVSWGRYGDRR